jgi:3D (Asp-Asp-Asp) domain-containing protein
MTWTMVATAYTAHCLGCSGYTASGIRLDAPYHVVAASRHWAIGTCLELLIDGQWTRYTVEDRGKKIRRKNRLDILVSSEAAAKSWGRRPIQVQYCDDYNL